MDGIHGFWAGAIQLASRLDLDELAGRFGGWSRLARATVDELWRAGVPPDIARGWVNTPPLQTLGQAFTKCCAGYPPALRLVPRAPPVVFVEGDITALHAPGVAVVGTRDCTPHGAASASTVAAAAARAGLVVVSGLARGIDSHAHRATLANGGRTVAVLGHGLGTTSPSSNRALRIELVRLGGAVISSWPDDVPPAPWTFPVRNRWIAALSRRVVVVEAPERSGALLTAVHLAELGRQEDLWAVPGPLGAPTWRGCAELIGLGARPLVDVDAFLEDLGVTPGLRHPDWLSALFAGAELHEAAEIRGVSSVELLKELAMMELQGRVVKLPGGRYAAGGGLP